MEATNTDVEASVPEAQEVVQPVEGSQPQETQAQQDSREYNWRELRESKKQLERELSELRAEVSRISSPPQKQEEPIGDDDLVEGRHLKKIYSAIENRLNNYAQEQVPDRLRAKFPDFDQVVNAETVEKFKASEPELFASLTASNDLYAKGVSAYKAIKKFGIAGDPEYSAEKSQMEKNLSKPGSPSSLQGTSPLAQANLYSQRLTPELRQQYYKEMVEAARG